MTPSCFCLRHCVFYCPVDGVPLSRDEQKCMREAQYLSGQNFQSTQGLTQLDPGQLLARGSSRGGRPGANSLLKQAIANRLKHEPPLIEEKEMQEETEENKEDKMGRSEMEMNRSIVGNPAWYRDDEGRTGFKPREWENLPNEQKEQVKRKKSKRKEEGTPVEEIDKELLESKEKEIKQEDRKLSKEKKKEMKKKEKEDKKREKEEKKKKKEEKKRLEKEEKERSKSQISLEEVKEKEEKKKGKHKEEEEEGLKEGTIEMVEKRKKRDKTMEKKEEGVKVTHNQENIEIKKEKKKKEKELTEQKTEHSKSKEDSHKKSQLEQSKDVVRRESSSSFASSNKSTDTVIGKPPRHPEKVLSSPGSSTEDDRPTRSIQIKPKKETIGERRDSSMSESSRISGKSVKFSDRVQTHEIERIVLTSSEDDVGVMSDDELRKPDVERRRKLVKMLQAKEEDMTDSDEDFEEQERLIEQKMTEEEIMRRTIHPVYNLEETGSQNSFYPEDVDPDRYLIEEDGSYISLDRLPAAVRRAFIAEMGMKREDEVNMGSMSKLHEEYSPGGSYQLPRSASGYLDDAYMVHSYQQAMYGAYHTDDRAPPEGYHHPYHHASSHSEGLHMPPDQRIEHLHSPSSSQVPPIYQHSNSSPKENQAVYQSSHKSMKADHLHAQSGTDPSIVSYQSPVASSLFSKPKTFGSSQLSPTEAYSNPRTVDISNQDRSPRTLGERRELHQLHESFYDNVPSRTSSLVGVSIAGSRDTGVLQETTPVPSPPRRASSTSIERKLFFESMNPSIGGVHSRGEHNTPTPSPPRVIVSQSSSHPQRVVVTTTTTTMMNRTETLEKKERNEEEMRRKFMKQFGGRKAPKAEEEDPLDPGPTMGSQESVYSTDSRESVVSEASIRKENFVRRNFNY